MNKGAAIKIMQKKYDINHILAASLVSQLKKKTFSD